MFKAWKAVPKLERKIGGPSPQTRLWVLGAVEDLGGQAETPFIAASLEDANIMVRLHAAEALERLTGKDFGLPKCGNGPCGVNEAGIRNAQRWWNDQRKEWNK
jgi:hypothetical protein